MKTPTDFRHESYRRHVAHYKNLVNGTDSNLPGRIWTDESTVDAWRHRRMHELLTPFLEAHAGARWLTVGDGRYGNEAHYLLTKGVEVMASDISDTLLKEANASGYIKDFRKENAEALSFGDGAFDNILCKKSFHHFPRPMIAMYEMLRVARTAVVLIEPCDPFVEATVPQILFRRLLNIVKRLAGLPRGRHRFEEVGRRSRKDSGILSPERGTTLSVSPPIRTTGSELHGPSLCFPLPVPAPRCKIEPPAW